MIKKQLLHTLIVASLAITIVGCAAQKPAQKPVAQSQPEPLNDFTAISRPCEDAQYDSENDFRGFGSGDDNSEQQARILARDAARAEIKSKLGGKVTGLVSDYTRSVLGKTGTKAQQMSEVIAENAIDKVLNDALTVCAKTGKTDRGLYRVYFVLSIPKGKLANAIVEGLASQEETQIEFNRDQARKYAEEKLQKMRDFEKSKQSAQ